MIKSKRYCFINKTHNNFIMEAMENNICCLIRVVERVTKKVDEHYEQYFSNNFYLKSENRSLIMALMSFINF